MRAIVIIVIVLGVLVGALAWVDVRVREHAEERGREQLAAAIPQAQRSDLRLFGFPFAGRILFDGSVERVEVTLHDLREREVALERVDLVIENLVLDRDRLLSDKELAVTDVGRVRVEGRITADAISRVAGVPLELRNGKARVTLQGQTVEASVAIAGPAVLLAVTGAPPLIVPLPPKKYLPCAPQVRIADDRLTIACTATELPDAVMDMLGRV